jgi:hypothetical protein
MSPKIMAQPDAGVGESKVNVVVDGEVVLFAAGCRFRYDCPWLLP